MVIAYIDRHDRASPAAGGIIDGMVRSGRNPGLVSMITAAEVLVGPARGGDHALHATIVEFLTQLPGLRLHEIDLVVAERAATLSGRHRLRLADALIIATGLVAGAGRIVSNDRAWSRLPVSEIAATIVLLDDHLPFTA